MSAIYPFSQRLSAGLALAAQGIPVFPCRVDGREPAIAGSFYSAVTDAEKIRRWVEDDGFNLAFQPETAGWCVVDLDDKNGKSGSANWYALGPSPVTYTVITPSGGQHLYFKGSLPPSASRLAPGVDTRGRGSYVLLPGSVVDGAAYDVLIDAPVADLPAWVSERLAAREVAPLKAATGVELDAEWNIEKARAILRDRVIRGDVAIEGQGGNNRTYRLATEILEVGLSEEAAGELIATEWNPYCLPPWSDEELADIVFHAWKYGQNAPGSKSDPDPAVLTAYQQAAAPPPEDSPGTALVKQWPSIMSAATLSRMVFDPPQWVWENRLLAFEPNLYTGDAGVGKTTLALNIAGAVAAGAPLLGQATMQMPVLLLVAEDTYGPVRDNLLAIRAALQTPEQSLEEIHVLSVKSDKIPGGHRLVRIEDNGRVEDTAFMREYLAPWLAAIDGPVLFVIDPLAEFAGFNRYKDEPCRALATTWLDAVCRIGAGRVTPLVTDHPSKASIQSGEHYAGSVQLKAAFSLFATLKGGQWSGMLNRQRDMTFSVIKGRYAGEEDTKFTRTARSPAFVLQGGPNHVPDDHQLAVYEHVYERVQQGLPVNVRNSGEYGPREVAYSLMLDEKTVIKALSALVARGWLARPKDVKGYAAGAKAPSTDELEGGY